MKLLGMDLETTGLDPKKDHITEYGMVLWDWDTQKPIMVESVLVNIGEPLTEEIKQITGLTDEMLSTYGIRPVDALAKFDYLARAADVVVGHNCLMFDKIFIESAYRKLADETIPEFLWIDTAQDVPYPDKVKTRKLVHLAAEHGFLNPFPHRACFDVLTMMKVLSCYDIDYIIKLAKEPMVVIQALVSYEDRGLASARGYRWKAESKQWLKGMKESLVDVERESCGFRTKIVEVS
jgi:DNA polymerase III subunit epsilon